MTQAEDAGASERLQAGNTRLNPLLPLWQALADIADPCQEACGYDLSILDLGIVNSLEARDGVVTVSVTFTEPACLFGYRIIQEIEARLARLPGVAEVIVSIDPYPLWEPSRLTERARQAYAARKAQFGPGVADQVFVDISRIRSGGAHV